MVDVLISARELHDRLAREADRPLVLDVRWMLGDPLGHQHYVERRIPGSVYVDMNTDLAAPSSPLEGRHPLPTPEHFQTAARGWGLRDGQNVVVLDDNGGMSAARAWWLLRWAGHENVRLLDGGLKGWVDAGYELDGLDTPVPVREPGDVQLGSGHMPTLDMDQAAEFSKRGVLLDARAGERYRGEQEPIDPRAGHIPGAFSAPTAENLQENGRFKDPHELRCRFEALGVVAGKPDAVAAYCGSGVTAAHEVVALAVAGIHAALYPGSWSQWSNDPERPAATGPEA
ncbi:sulfurtransferase [Actinospica sp.]|jgi:thiosulfate/3-mercaptopyruvate sulfurtransferase|uniref:sulfurtransferase n=1 Tax=Actinospica sp. TaxID=1872142 RepID=UPI002C034B24|nr:sulfurtransferase [Actinospica sp.]HWG26912.1 sulfurtransferase [Actinospica sp.]